MGRSREEGPSAPSRPASGRTKLLLHGALLTGAASLLTFVLQPGTALASRAHARSHAAASSTQYYVSLGDSYSVGYQPEPTPGATSGYTGFVAKAEKLTLENFGCGGATTSSILNYTGKCEDVPTSGEYGPPAITGTVGEVISGDTQVQDAVSFIKQHSGQIALITVSIGGNDVTACASASQPIPCVSAATASIQTNVSNLASQLRGQPGRAFP